MRGVKTGSVVLLILAVLVSGCAGSAYVAAERGNENVQSPGDAPSN